MTVFVVPFQPGGFRFQRECADFLSKSAVSCPQTANLRRIFEVFTTQAEDFAWQVAGFALQVKAFAPQVAAFTVQVKDFGPQVADFTVQVATFAL